MLNGEPFASKVILKVGDSEDQVCVVGAFSLDPPKSAFVRAGFTERETRPNFSGRFLRESNRVQAEAVARAHAFSARVVANPPDCRSINEADLQRSVLDFGLIRPPQGGLDLNPGGR